MMLLLIACAHNARVSSEVQPEDLAQVDPEQIYELRDEEQAHVQARGELDNAQRDELRAARELEETRAEVEAQKADLKAAKAEIAAAEANRDANRYDTARRNADTAEHDVAVAEAKEVWKRAALKEAEAKTAEAEALVDLRLAELEMARVELVSRNGGDQGYVVSDFIQQLATTRQAWETSRQRARDRALDTEEAKRAYERAEAGVPVGTR
jgi:hypothetical protein